MKQLDWKPTVAYYRAVVFAVTLIGIGLLARRPDLLVLATPAAVVATWSALTRPSMVPEVSDRLGRATLGEGTATTWRFDARGDGGLDLASAAVADMDWMERRPNRGAVLAVATGGLAATSLDVRSTRWGRRDLEPLQITAASSWGSFQYVVGLPPRSMVTLPSPAPFDSAAPIHPTNGLVGAYRSGRPGEGAEFAGLRPFRVGDRMRRINWNRSLRADALQVNATWADQDTHVALVIDVEEDLGVSEGIDGRASSLDTTVRAAAAIAEHYVRRGNRVSLRSFDPAARIAVAPGGGLSHLRRVLDTLARVNGPVGRFDRQSRPREASADVTIVLSPMTSADALGRAVLLSRSGGSAVVIDTLPDHVVDDDDPLLALAWRVRLLERQRDLRRARRTGVIVSRWSGPGSLDEFLQSMARQAAAPRIRS